MPIPNGLPHDASSTILLLTSPQKLAKEKRIRDALLRCAVAGTLRLVTVDEAHQYTMHGRELRDSIRYLRDKLFRWLFDPTAWFKVLFLAVMTTMSADLLQDFPALTHVDWEDERHQMWAAPRDFRQREIKMELHPTEEIPRRGPPDEDRPTRLAEVAGSAPLSNEGPGTRSDGRIDGRIAGGTPPRTRVAREAGQEDRCASLVLRPRDGLLRDGRWQRVPAKQRPRGGPLDEVHRESRW